MDEDPLDACQLSNPLIQFDVRHDAAGQHDVPETGLLEIELHVAGRHDFEDVLVRRGDVDLRELRREQTGEIEVVDLPDPEAARRDFEAREQHIAEDLGIAVGGEPDNLAFVPAGLETEARRHRLVERPERVRELYGMHPVDLPVLPDADRPRQSRAVAVERDDQRFVEAARVESVRRVGEVVLHPFQLRSQPELVERPLELLVPLPVERRRRLSPLLGGTLRDVP